MDLKTYTLEELKSLDYPFFASDRDPVPFSPLRYQSYLKNPRAEPTDAILFEMRHEGRLIGYRTVLPDGYADHTGRFQRFAWLSGNYVSPEFRREGISTRLLQLAETRWDGRLMYTNYAPDSKAVYDRTGQFPLLAQRDGKRYYLRGATEELLGKRLGGQAVLRRGDQLVNRLREGTLRKHPPVDPTRCQIDRIQTLEGELSQLIDASRQHSLFRRDTQIFSWILEYPWVTDQPADPVNYHFSYQARRFENILLRFRLPDGGALGLLWMIIHNRKLTVPYLFVSGESIYSYMASTVVHTMITQECAYATLRHSEMQKHLAKEKRWFLSTRKMPQLIFAHRQIAGEVPDQWLIHDGDGDVVFTG